MLIFPKISLRMQSIESRAIEDIDWSKREIYRLEKTVEAAWAALNMHKDRIKRLQLYVKDQNERDKNESR